MPATTWTQRLPFPALCRGDVGLLESWITGRQPGALHTCIILITLGCGAYGFTVGLWRGWEMATYVAVKLPAAIVLTLVVNGLLNGMLGLALGSGIGFRQSLQFLLSAFAIMSVTLGALSPVTLFLALNTPPPTDPGARDWHSLTLLSHTLAIAVAGVIAHLKLLRFVRSYAETKAAGTRTFFAWLAGNLFVGAQISWILRPFFGSPGLEVQFLRPNPLEGSFYDTILRSVIHLITF